MTLKGGFLQTSQSLILIRLNLLCLAQGLCVQNSTIVSQLIYLVIFSHLLRQLGTLVFGLTQIFPSLAICKVCFVHIGDLKHFRGYLTHDAALLDANALAGSHLDYFNSLFRSLSALDLHSSSVSRTVLLELFSIPPSTYISLMLERLFIGSFCFQDGPIGVQVPTKWLS